MSNQLTTNASHFAPSRHGAFSLGIEMLAFNSPAFSESLRIGESWRLHLAYAAIELARCQLLVEPNRLGDSLALAPAKSLSEPIFGQRLPGIRRALGRLGPLPMREGQYRLLARALACPIRRKRVFHAPQVTSGLLELLDILPDMAISANSLGWDHGDQVFLASLRQAVRAVRDSLDSERANSAWQALADLENPRDISDWYFNHLSELPLPSPPWEGSGGVTVIRTHGELRDTAKFFRNCLWERRSDFSTGNAFAYICREPRMEAVAVIYPDACVRWHLSEVRGIANRTLSPEQLGYFVELFDRAGIPYVPYRHGPWMP